MRAVILAAGVSSRLRPVTNNIPKSLVKVGGRPLLERSLSALSAAGIGRCVIVTGYQHEKVEAFLASVELATEVRLVFNPLFDRTNNNYSLWLARSHAAGDDLLLLDSDVLFDRRLVARLRDAPFENALLMRRGQVGEEEMKMELDDSGRVVSIAKGIAPSRAAGESVGIGKFSAAATERLFTILERRRERDEFYEASFQEMIDAGVDVYAVDSRPYPCMEIDTLDDLKAAERLAPTLPN